MTKTTAPEYFLTRCHEGHVIHWTAAEREAVADPYASMKWSFVNCPARTDDSMFSKTFGRCFHITGFRPIRGRVTEKECDPRCQYAVGPSCDCSCGGRNHGAGQMSLVSA